MTAQNHCGQLTTRSVIALKGEETRDFLQGLVTNDVMALTEAAPLYAALLTPQGKFLFDFLIFEDGDRILLDCEASRLGDLMRRLMMYRLRLQIDITDESNALSVGASFGGRHSTDIDWKPDPRHPGLGMRAILSGTLTAVDDAYDTHRLSLGIPDGSRDIEVDRMLILESNIDELNGVNFTKGCYVGQENTARMKHRKKVRKRLMPVTVAGELPASGTDITNDGKKVGTIRSGQATRALAHLRIEGLEDGTTLQAGETELTVDWPDWLEKDIAP